MQGPSKDNTDKPSIEDIGSDQSGQAKMESSAKGEKPSVPQGSERDHVDPKGTESADPVASPSPAEGKESAGNKWRDFVPFPADTVRSQKGTSKVQNKSKDQTANGATDNNGCQDNIRRVGSYRCPVCNRITRCTKCANCRTDNTEWASWNTWAHLKRFPWIVQAIVLILLTMQVVVTVNAMLVEETRFAATIRLTAILSLIASCVIVALVFVFRLSLRNYELLRRAKQKRKGLSLITLGILAFSVFLVTLGAVSVLTYAVRDFTMGGSWTLSIQDLEGKPVRVLAAPDGEVSQPQWSFDGGKLLYSSNRDGDWEIYAYDLESQKTITLTNNKDQDTSPAWLQDGGIVFASDRTGTWEWYTMDPSRSENTVKRLAAWRKTAELGWSSDGTRYAFTEPGRSIFYARERMSAIEERYPLIRSLGVSLAYPMLILSVMLLGVAGFVKKTEDEAHRPIFLNDNLMIFVAFRSFYRHMKPQLTEKGQDRRGPNAAESQPDTTDSSDQSFNADVMASKRTADGALELIVNLRTLEEQEGAKGETKTVLKDTFYEVITDEWAQIQSVQKCDPKKLQTRMV